MNMQFRTDLALEQRESIKEDIKGVECSETDAGSSHITHIKIINEEGAAALSKPVGNYITVEVPPLSDDATLDAETVTAIKNELTGLLPPEGLILVAGLGNTNITPDALGPKTAGGILATRHITGEIARSAGLEGLRGVCVISPGVLGQTGIESSEILEGIVNKVKPAAVIVIDALASRQLSRLGCTIQMSDTGINPGAGVGNARKEISRSTVGVPVISVGVPTVVDAATMAYDLTGSELPEDKVEPRGAKMIVTPREIDLIIKRAAELVSHSINCALQPSLDSETLLSLVS